MVFQTGGTKDNVDLRVTRRDDRSSERKVDCREVVLNQILTLAIGPLNPLIISRRLYYPHSAQVIESTA